MIVPLASYWSHPTIFEAIRPHLFVLTAEVRCRNTAYE
jgi:hypothetical protein